MPDDFFSPSALRAELMRITEMSSRIDRELALNVLVPKIQNALVRTVDDPNAKEVHGEYGALLAEAGALSTDPNSLAG
jgi:hypothetical protein